MPRVGTRAHDQTRCFRHRAVLQCERQSRVFIDGQRTTIPGQNAQRTERLAILDRFGEQQYCIALMIAACAR